MKNTFLILTILICQFISKALLAQNIIRPDDLPSQSLIYKNFAGTTIRPQSAENTEIGRWRLNGNDYEIMIEHYYRKKGAIIGKNTFLKMLRGEAKGKDDTVVSIPYLPSPNALIYKHAANTVLPSKQTIYVFPNNKDTGFYRVSFTPFFEADTIFEKTFLKSVFYDDIYDTIFRIKKTNSIELAGRLISFEKPFRIMAPRNIFFPEEEVQISWTEHSTMARAMEMREIQLLKNYNPKLAEPIIKDSVDILFENIPAKALCLHYREKKPWNRKTEAILIVYYIVIHVREVFICCLISYYENGKGHNQRIDILHPVISNSQ
jgi:hypothetical protein